jgi:hypothetical protein
MLLNILVFLCYSSSIAAAPIKVAHAATVGLIALSPGASVFAPSQTSAFSPVARLNPPISSLQSIIDDEKTAYDLDIDFFGKGVNEKATEKKLLEEKFMGDPYHILGKGPFGGKILNEKELERQMREQRFENDPFHILGKGPFGGKEYGGKRRMLKRIFFFIEKEEK